MKLHTALLVGALILFPGVALAQVAPPVPPCASTAPAASAPMDSAAMQAHMAQMKASMKQLETLHHALRASMLAALSPAHRAYLGSVIGNLAIASKPDFKAAAAALDAKLSASEKSAILAAHTKFQAQMKTAMASMRQAMPHPSSPNPGGQIVVMHTAAGSDNDVDHHHAPTAGGLLLELAGPGMMDHPMMTMMIRRDHMMPHSHPMMPAPTASP